VLTREAAQPAVASMGIQYLAITRGATIHVSIIGEVQVGPHHYPPTYGVLSLHQVDLPAWFIASV